MSINAAGALPIMLVLEELFFYNLKLCSYSFCPIIKFFDPVLNCLGLCICNYFIDLKTVFFSLSLFYEKTIKGIEWMV